MKFKINFKLTTFLVSLFLSLLLVILGSSNKYCLCFGFILMGLSLQAFVWYNTDKTRKAIVENDKEIVKIEDSYKEDEHMSDEDLYVLDMLYKTQKKLMKKRKQTTFVFTICGVMLAFLGILSIF